MCKVLNLVLYPSSPTFIIVLIIQSFSVQHKKTWSQTGLHRVMSLLASCSNFARDKLSSMCLGPEASAVMKGKEILAFKSDRIQSTQSTLSQLNRLVFYGFLSFLLVSLQSFLTVSDIIVPKYMWQHVNHESSRPLARLKAPS